MAEAFSPLSLKCKIPDVQSHRLLTPYDLGERENFPWTDDVSGLGPDLLDGIESFRKHLAKPYEWELEAWRAKNRRIDNRTEYRLWFTLYNENQGDWPPTISSLLPFNLRVFLSSKPWFFNRGNSSTVDIHAPFGKFPQYFDETSDKRLFTPGSRIDPFNLGIFTGQEYIPLFVDTSRVIVGVTFLDGVENIPNPESLKKYWGTERDRLSTQLIAAQAKVDELKAVIREHDTIDKGQLGGHISSNNRVVKRLMKTPIPNAFYPIIPNKESQSNT